MKLTEINNYKIIQEGLSHPIIVVDVQPEYANYGNNRKKCDQIIQFVNKQTGPVLMFVNAEGSGVSSDSLQDIKQYWEETIGYTEDENEEYQSNINWNRFEIVDKGYGHFRSWMDNGISEGSIIKVIREMYQQRINDSRDFDEGVLQTILDNEYEDWMEGDALFVNWTSIKQLRKFNGAYIVGGGRMECLREVELLMNAFNIKYKRIDSLVY
jgi:hypothetical protein